MFFVESYPDPPLLRFRKVFGYPHSDGGCDSDAPCKVKYVKTEPEPVKWRPDDVTTEERTSKTGTDSKAKTLMALDKIVYFLLLFSL